MSTITELLPFKNAWYSFRLETDLMQSLDKFSRELRISKAEIIRRGVKQMFDLYNFRG